MNTVTDWQYDRESNLGYITVNGHRIALARKCTSYKNDLETPVYHYQVQVANDWNMSNVFTIESAQI